MGCYNVEAEDDSVGIRYSGISGSSSMFIVGSVVIVAANSAGVLID